MNKKHDFFPYKIFPDSASFEEAKKIIIEFSKNFDFGDDIIVLDEEYGRFIYKGEISSKTINILPDYVDFQFSIIDKNRNKRNWFSLRYAFRFYDKLKFDSDFLYIGMVNDDKR